MSTTLKSILNTWYPRRDDTEWVLCTLYKIEGSSYRKPGAMMMFSGDGAQLGLLSGGCLEGDIQRHAKTVMESKLSKTITYDATDEDDITFQLGIGCGGIVHILMQPITKDNQYLQLDTLLDVITAGQTGIYQQKIKSGIEQCENHFEHSKQQNKWSVNRKAELIELDNELWLCTHIYPEPHILVIGGGYDARPVTAMAKQMGWTVSLWDPRPANGRKAYFPTVDNILSGEVEELTQFAQSNHITGIVLMTHSVRLDASALKALYKLPLAYMGLLGPTHRRQQVIEESGVNEADFKVPLSGPIGLDIGGETPESIALSILSEIHAVLCDKNTISVSNVV